MSRSQDTLGAKDEVEEKLEHLVFGDDAGFNESLRLDDEDFETLDRYDQRSKAETSLALEDELEEADDSRLFFLDSGPTTLEAPALIQDDDNASPTSDAESKAAWIDSDDDRLVVSLASNNRLRKLRVTESEDLISGREYTKRLRRHFEQLYPPPAWATQNGGKRKQKRRRSSQFSDENISEDEEMDIDSDDPSTQPLLQLLRDSSFLNQGSSTLSKSRRKLRPDVVEVSRLKDIGGTHPSTITTLTFHPTYPLLLSGGGPSGLVTLTHVSPSSPNPHSKVTSLHIRQTPLTTAYFLPAPPSSPNPNSSTLALSGPRRYFHTWSLSTGRVAKISRIAGQNSNTQTHMSRFKLSPCGRWMALLGTGRKGGAFVNIISASSWQWVAECRVEGNGGIADACFWGDGEGLTCIGKGGEGVEYSITERRVIGRWMDEGAVGITVLALSGGSDRWMAVGSSSGIVNLYDRSEWRRGSAVPQRPKPARVLDQLTTPISCMSFSNQGEVLCMASKWKRDALRLVHLPSCTVYRNWPTGATPLGRVSAIAWSERAEGLLLATGNEQGKVRLWEVRG